MKIKKFYNKHFNTIENPKGFDTMAKDFDYKELINFAEKFHAEQIKTSHRLKTLPEFFEAVTEGRKRFEIRKDDRNFKVDDTLVLKEWNGQQYTGRKRTVHVSHIFRDAEKFGLQKGFVILSLY